jgi:hypothetical protein
MKKVILVTGFILIILGTIFSYAGKTSTQVLQNQLRVARYIEYGKVYSTTWSLDANLSEGEYVGIDFRPAADWSLPQFDEEILPPVNGTLYLAVKRLEVNVTNLQGDLTSFTVYLVITEPYGGAEDVTIFPDYFNINFQGGGLVVEENYPKIKTVFYNNKYYNMILLGKAPFSGNYTFNFLLDYKIVDAVFDESSNKTIPWIHDPRLPPYVWIYGLRESTETNYPYSNLGYFGPFVVAAGAVLLVCGLLLPQKIRRKDFKR